MSTIKDAVDSYIKASVKSWAHDRTMTVGASEIGQCERKTWFAKAEQTELASTFERNPDYVESWGARERGNLIERHLVAPAIRRKYQSRARYLGNQQISLIDGMLSATPDCLIIGRKKEPAFLIEIKSIDPRAQLEGPKAEHVYQVQVQMGMLNSKNTTPHWAPQYAILVYVNASFMDEITEFRIDYDPEIYMRAQARAMRIMTASSHHELKPEGWIAGGRECEYCPFTDACGRARKEVPTQVIAPADAQFIAEMRDMAADYKSLEQTIVAYEDHRRSIQNSIKERMREKGQSRIVGNDFSISWAPVKGRESYDMKAMAEAGIEIEKYKREGTPGDRLTVTLKMSTMADKAEVA